MLNPIVAVYLHRGAPYDALEACLSEISQIAIGEMHNVARLKGHDYAMARARELTWIAGRFARQERWDDAKFAANMADTIFEAPAGTEARLHVNMLIVAGIPTHENCNMARMVLQAAMLDKIDTDMANGLCQVAAHPFENGDYDTAQKICTLALEIDSNHAAAHMFLGVIAMNQGRSTVAVRELETAARLGSEDAQTILRSLR